jgi:hypothetical protein
MVEGEGNGEGNVESDDRLELVSSGVALLLMFMLD